MSGGIIMSVSVIGRVFNSSIQEIVDSVESTYNMKVDKNSLKDVLNQGHHFMYFENGEDTISMFVSISNKQYEAGTQEEIEKKHLLHWENEIMYMQDRETKVLIEKYFEKSYFENGYIYISMHSNEKNQAIIKRILHESSGILEDELSDGAIQLFPLLSTISSSDINRASLTSIKRELKHRFAGENAVQFSDTSTESLALLFAQKMID